MTMKAIQIIKECRRVGIALDVVDGQIKVQGGKSNMTSSLLDQIKQNKPEIIEALQAAKQHADQTLARLTSSDFPLAKLSNSQVQNLEAKYPNIQDIYISTPMQRGMLFHGLLAGEENAYVNVTQCNLSGQLDVSAFKEAWKDVVARHDIFRTCFVGFDYDVIHQLVQSHCELSFKHLDWRGEADIADKLSELYQIETTMGFDFNKAPLMRWTLVRLSETKYHFIWANHHALLDGWCSSLVFSEVLGHYIKKTGNALDTALAPSVSYKNYIKWLSDQSQDSAKNYWKSVVEHIEDKTELPMRINDREGEAEHKLTIGENATEKLIELAKESQLTLNALVQSAWAAVLHYFSGDDEVVFGATISGRPPTLENVESIVGLFINSIPVSAKIHAAMPLSDLFSHLQNMNSESQEFGYFSLSEIQQLSAVSSGSNLFDSLVVFENYPIDQAVAKNSAKLPIDIDNVGSFGETNFPLTIVVSNGECLNLKLRYKKGMFADSQIEMIGETLFLAMSRIANAQITDQVASLKLSDVTQKLDSLPIVNRLKSYPKEKCLHEIFEEQVEVFSDRIAVSCGGTQLTYKELNQKANQLANLLRTKGVGSESLVALCIDRNEDILVAILAVLKAGGAYVPVDPRYPAAHVSHVLEDSQPTLVITKGEYIDIVSGTECNVVFLDDHSSFSTFPSSNLTSVTRPDNLAYIIYTSGSTGKPKGVMIEHHNVVRLMQSTEQHFHFNENDVWTLFHSYAFDFSVWEIWGALFYGGRVAVVNYENSRSPEKLISIINEQGVTVLNQTPSAFYQLLANLPQHLDLSSLRYVIFGGEALATEKLTNWFERTTSQKTQLINMYGITETTVHVTFSEVNDTSIAAQSIGKPLDDLAVYVMNKNSELVPAGVTGEMVVSGGGLARGYLNRPELNSERFVTLTLQDQMVRCYRSGDYCQQDENCNLIYQGRIDHQVKIRGFRIELGEIQHSLLQDPNVENAVVIADEMPAGDKRLVAYVQQKESMPFVEFVSEMRSFLNERLPPHMIPALFIEVNEFTLTNNGKINTKALPAPTEKSIKLDNYVAPKSEVEIQLCEIWQRVLPVEKVGIKDNFFSLGGDSILAIRITALAKQSEIDLTLSELFEQQTIERLAALPKFTESAIFEDREIEPFSMLNENEASNRDDFVDAYPLSTLQEGMVFHTAMEETMYHDIMSHHIKWQWNEALFVKAVNYMVAHHPILRTSYDLSGERPIQLVHTSIETPLTVIDIQTHSASEQECFIANWIDEEKRTPFIWSEAPLFRLFVHLRGENSFQFTLSCHHSILDGWSVVSLKTELYDLYRKLIANESLPILKIDWAQRDFVAQELSSMADNEARNYWMSAIENAPLMQVPEVLTQNDKESTNENVVNVDQVNQFAKRAIELARELGVPLQHVLLAVHFKVLSFISGSQAALSCVTNNGRSEKQGGDSGFGLFLNLLPVSIDVKPGSWKSLIASIKETMIANAKYRHFPLSVIQRECQRDFSEVTFNYTHFHGYQDVAANDEVDVVDSINFARANFDFKVMFQRDHESDFLNLAIRYNHQKYGHSYIESIANYYVVALRELVTNPSHNHSQCPLICTETMTTLGQWGTGEVDQAFRQTTFISEFEQQCKHNPNMTAVTIGQQALTYIELNRKANRLAAYLQEQELGHGDYIGIFTLRNIELLIAMLAIQKIGAAYVLIEPNNSEQRIDYILKNAKIELVLTQSELIQRLPLKGIDVLPLEESINDEKWLEEYGSDDLQVAQHADYLNQTAYVIYTSGTTGQPKGVEVSFHSLVDYLHFSGKRYFDDSLTGSYVCSSHGFDLAIPGLLVPLMKGKTVHLAPWGDEIESLPTALSVGSGNLLVRLTPLHMQALLDLLDKPVSRAHTFVIGGDTLTVEKLNAIRAFFPNANIYNHYGPSEAVVGCTLFDTKQFLGADGVGSVPIGYPMDNTHLRVLDKNMLPVPVGTTGELFVGGDCVAKGYLNSPDLTSEKFLTLPDNNGAMRRFYRTGDYVRWLPEGCLQFVKRIDKQIKVRGYRVDLSEIELALRRSNLVSDFAVVAYEQDSEQNIAAYVVMNEKCNSITLLEKAVALALPPYMVPKALIELEQLPMTANGKLDKAALPSVTSGNSSTDTFVAPQNDVQEKMCAIWQQLLNVQEVGIRDDFFALGGHSLLATRLINIVKKETGKTIPLKALFENPTVQMLCDLEIREVQESNISPITPISKRLADDELTEEGEL